MLTVASLAALALCVYVAYVVLGKIRNPLGSIPGPKELPIFGSALAIKWPAMHLQLTEWSKLYGPILKYSVFGRNVVVISNVNDAKEALITRGTDFAGRPPSYRAQRATFFKSVAFETFTDETIEKRKMLHHVLAAHGSGLGRLEAIMMEGMGELLDRLASLDGRPFDALKVTAPFVCNVMATLMYGERYSYDDPIIEKLLELNHAIIELASVSSEGNELDVLPWLRFTGLSRKGLKKLKRAESLRDALYLGKILEARATLDPDNPRGAIDDLLLLKRDPESRRHFDWDNEHLSGVSNDIVTGGISTSVRSMQAAYVVLVNYPKVQSQIQEEIDLILGAVPPSASDRGRMQYVEAFILELLRYTSIVPLLVPRSTLNDTTVGGYRIPKHCMVMINAWAIHHNEEVYPKPFDFDPTRFLDSEGRLHSHDHPARSNFLAFGAGRRICPGENFAHVRLFLMLVSILQRFTLVADDSKPLPNPDPRGYELGIVLMPPQCFVRAMPRV